MKAEPINWEKFDNTDLITFGEAREDIKSAVEWFKAHLREPYISFNDERSKNNTIELIDEAFEDVVRK